MAEGAGPELRYETQVVAVGAQAASFFAEGLVVFFGEDAPEELAEFSVIHRPTVTVAGVAPGDVVTIGEARLTVLAVGPVANENLANLGHLTLKRNGLHDAPLPGDVCCDTGPVPEIAVGDRISIASGM